MPVSSPPALSAPEAVDFPPDRRRRESLSPPDSVALPPPHNDECAPLRSHFCPLEISSGSDSPTTPPYPPPLDFPAAPVNCRSSFSTGETRALVHVADSDLTPDIQAADEKPSTETTVKLPNRDSGIVNSSVTSPLPSLPPSVSASASTSPAVRPKHPNRLHSTSTDDTTSTHSDHCTSTASLASPKSRQLLNRRLTSLSSQNISARDLFDSPFEGANYSFESLPGLDDLNSYEMPHNCRKFVSAKETFKDSVEVSPSTEVPHWHASLAQRSLKYLDAPLSSAYEEPPLTFVSPLDKGLWGRSGDWELRTGTGRQVKGPEARSVAAAMAAMLYEEGYSDILPPKVGSSSELKSLEPSDVALSASPTTPTEPPPLRRPSDDDTADSGVILTSGPRHLSALDPVVLNGDETVLPTLHPDMQENVAGMPTARDLYQNDVDLQSLSVEGVAPLPQANFRIFSGPSTPEDPPPAFEE